MQRAALDTPIGTLIVDVDRGGVVRCEFAEDASPPPAAARGPDAADVASRLHAYLGGDLDALDAIPSDAPGTPFQRDVWRELRRIPAGSTDSYSELARRIGRPDAVRAVGMANARNPVAVIVPCHRVIRADGDLCGYAGGVERKRWLLAHERLAVGGFRVRMNAGARVQIDAAAVDPLLWSESHSVTS